MIIDSDNYLAAGIETLFFPGGEPHAKIPMFLQGNVLLFLKLRTWYDTGIAACVIDALSRNSRIKQLDVFIPYFPGARQDKDFPIGEPEKRGLAPLTVEIIGFLLDPVYGRTRFHLFDPHSVAACRAIQPTSVLMPADLDIPIRDNIVGVIAPDEGATARAESFRRKFYPRAHMIQCRKHRDPVTGKLSGYIMPSIPEIGGYVVVDDICDGGGTFNLLADAFGKDPNGQSGHLELFVSHGIFSAPTGLNALHRRYTRIITTDSWCKIPESHHSRLEIIPLSPLFSKITGREYGSI